MSRGQEALKRRMKRAEFERSSSDDGKQGLNELAAAVHENAVAHGWWEQERELPEILMLCVSELAEALEEYRSGRPVLYFPCNAGGVCCEEDGSAHCGSRPYNPEIRTRLVRHRVKTGRRGGGIGRLHDPHSGLLRARRN